MAKKTKDKKIADVHRDLKGFEISINSFGEMQANISIEKINAFLNEKSKTDDGKGNGEEE